MAVIGSPVRLALIGAGRMGRLHREVARRLDAVVVTVVVEPNLAEAARSDDGAVVFRDLDEALTHGGFDAAVVAAPSDLHRQLVERLLEAGVPTLCEKPCGLTVTDARAATDLARTTGVLLQIGYWRRFVPELVDLQLRIASGEFGAVALIEAWQWDREPPPAEFRRRSGGILLDMGVHEIDQIRWLTGQNLAVHAAVPSDVVSVAPVDRDPESVAVLARLDDGGVAFVSLGRRHADGDACWLEVIGTDHAERLDFMRGPAADDVFHNALTAQLASFASAVRGGPFSGATGADAVTALEVLAAADDLLAASTSSLARRAPLIPTPAGAPDSELDG